MVFMKQAQPRTVFAALLTCILMLQMPTAAADGVVTAAGSLPAAVSRELAADDLVEIKVFQEPDLDTTARISPDGRITFPLIGEVSVAGRTPQQAARLIRDKLDARFLVDPQVNLRVVETARRLFTVLGQVQKPGTYRFPERETLNLIQVIGIAGGYTRLADPARITVKRVSGGRETVFRVDGKRMARDSGAEAFEVRAGDLITVSERAF
jgi:protein involved in polysaccharide export with SLBB domain